ncbi:hypothetical protein CLIB1444_01S17084 [[Candida] jaroonii]|uniref:Uncharacterized protein n=1 Tax=[Candida] jaroonii TaxID=467808 RepID=A0ACA9Y1S1_9ASCO|nr:hypothetical protein CLIB1444_01S17084 [[Candida] jaroonii]
MPVKSPTVNPEGQEILSTQKRLLGQSSEMNEKSKDLVLPDKILHPPPEDEEKEELKRKIRFLEVQNAKLTKDCNTLKTTYKGLHDFTKKLHATHAIVIKKNTQLRGYVETLQSQLSGNCNRQQDDSLCFVEDQEQDQEQVQPEQSQVDPYDDPIKLGRVLEDDDSKLSPIARLIKRFEFRYNFHLDIETNLAKQLAIINQVEVARDNSHKPEEFDVTQMLATLTIPQVPEDKKCDDFCYSSERYWRGKPPSINLQATLKYLSETRKPLTYEKNLGNQASLIVQQLPEDFGNVSSKVVDGKLGKKKRFRSFCKKVLSRLKSVVKH